MRLENYQPYGQPKRQVNNKYKAAMNSQSFRFWIIKWHPSINKKSVDLEVVKNDIVFMTYFFNEIIGGLQFSKERM